VAAALLVLAAALVYGRGLVRADEEVIQVQARALVERGGRDRDGHVLPLFLHAEGELWLPAIPVYAAAALITIVPAVSNQARWAAASFGALDIVLLYVLAVRCLRLRVVGVFAALVLLVTPSHLLFSRTAAIDGIWQVPLILGWALGMTALTHPPSRRARWIVASGALSLAASAYTQPSGALMLPLFALVSAFAVWRADGWRLRDAVPAAFAFAVALLPLLIWFARFPGSYPDTLGRWVVHPAHLRNPIDWLRALTNWHRVANTVKLFWDFFVPSHLFLAPGASALCGMFLTLTAVPLAFGVRETVRPSDATVVAARLRPVIVSACLIGPLAAAMFDQARADSRALIVVPFGVLVAAWGAAAAWRDGGMLRRGILISSMIGAAVQAALCIR